MYIDASLNSVSTIVANLYQSFHEAAVRCLEYVRVFGLAYQYVYPSQSV
jgi:hypothetical protein